MSEATHARIATRIERLERDAPPEMREEARALVADVLAFHGDALARILDAIAKRDAKLVDELRADALVASVLDLHDLGADPSLVSPARLLGKKKKPQLHDEHACDLCGAPAGPRHPHLVELATREPRCACMPCATVLDGTKFRRVPDAVTRVTTTPASDPAWKALGVPVAVAFFVRGDDGGIRAQFPGAAGAVDSSVPEEAFAAIAALHPEIAAMRPEVEALVVRRTEGAREHWIVGVDRAWALAGRLRAAWTGFTGGDGVRSELDAFFAELRT